MLSTGFLISGLIIGFSIAAPVGPIGLLCIQRTIASGQRSGLVSGLGAASADAVYGSIAGVGVGVIIGFLVAQKDWIQLIGGVVLLLIGVKIFLSRNQNTSPNDQPIVERSLRDYFSTFFLTLTNPVTILSFMAIFTSLGLASSTHKFLSAGLLISGVFAGSMLWWIILTSVIAKISTRPNRTFMSWVGRFSGIIIMGFGLFGVASSGMLF